MIRPRIREQKTIVSFHIKIRTENGKYEDWAGPYQSLDDARDFMDKNADYWKRRGHDIVIMDREKRIHSHELPRD